MKSKSVIYKNSKKNGGWMIRDETIVNHLRQNSKIRKSRKEIVKPDLDAIMELALSPSPKNN